MTNDWIPVEERLPDFETEVHAISLDCLFCAKLSKHGYWYDTIVMGDREFIRPLILITHWKPLNEDKQ